MTLAREMSAQRLILVIATFFFALENPLWAHENAPEIAALTAACEQAAPRKSPILIWHPTLRDSNQPASRDFRHLDSLPEILPENMNPKMKTWLMDNQNQIEVRSDPLFPNKLFVRFRLVTREDQSGKPSTYQHATFRILPHRVIVSSADSTGEDARPRDFEQNSLDLFLSRRTANPFHLTSSQLQMFSQTHSLSQRRLRANAHDENSTVTESTFEFDAFLSLLSQLQQQGMLIAPLVP